MKKMLMALMVVLMSMVTMAAERIDESGDIVVTASIPDDTSSIRVTLDDKKNTIVYLPTNTKFVQMIPINENNGGILSQELLIIVRPMREGEREESYTLNMFVRMPGVGDYVSVSKMVFILESWKGTIVSPK